MNAYRLRVWGVAAVALHIVAVCLLWRYWDLHHGLRSAIDAGDHLRYIARVGFIFTAFPLLLAFEYLTIKSLVTKEGFAARLMIALYGRSGSYHNIL